MLKPHSTSPPLASASAPPRGRRSAAWYGLLAAGLFLAGSAALEAMSVRQLDLKSLCGNAHHIVRGTVVSVRQGSVAVGGGTLPTVTYRIQVKEAIAGRAYGMFEFTSVAPVKPVPQAGGIQRAALIELPELKTGQDYLLFTTKPSAVGLSTVVGLGQGCFSISVKGGKELAVNERNNIGLGLPQTGPADYQALTVRIRELLANRPALNTP